MRSGALQKLQSCGASIYVDRWSLLPLPKRLYDVRLEYKRVNDDMLSALSDIVQVSQLFLRGSSVTGAFLSVAKCHRYLEFLDAGETLFDDDDVYALPRFRRLQHVLLDSTRISDSGIESLAQLPSLKYVAIANTDVSLDGLHRLHNSKSLLYVYLSWEQFGGQQVAVNDCLGTVKVFWVGKEGGGMESDDQIRGSSGRYGA